MCITNPLKISDFLGSDIVNIIYLRTIITNLDKDAFPIQEIKRLYNMRWGIETSFRDLKYALALLHLHAKKVDFIYQEIFAKLTIILRAGFYFFGG